MDIYYIAWFIVALVLVIVEMGLMSFYLMAVAVGAVAGGICAYIEGSITQQFIVSGIVTIIASFGAIYLRRKLKSAMDKNHNELDKGQRVVVQQDKIKKDGTATVNYRGTEWVAYKENELLTPGIYFIVRLDGPQLVLGDKIPNSENAVDDPHATDTVQPSAALDTASGEVQTAASSDSSDSSDSDKDSTARKD